MRYRIISYAINKSTDPSAWLWEVFIAVKLLKNQGYQHLIAGDKSKRYIVYARRYSSIVKEKEKIELDFLDSKMEKQQFDVYDFKNKVEKKEREISDILISKEKNKRNSVGSFQRRQREKYWYPDFIEEKDETQRRNIMDAKYKYWNFNNEDMHQMLSYLYITGGKRCGIVFPTNEQIDVKYLILNPYVGFYADEDKEEIRCYQLPFIIPIYEENYKKEQEKECKSEAYRNFCKKIEESCNIWKKQFEEYFLNCK